MRTLCLSHSIGLFTTLITILIFLSNVQLAAQTILSEDFEGGTLGNFTNTGVIGSLTWVNTNNRGSDGGHSSSRSAYFGDTNSFTYDIGAQVKANLISSSMDLSSYTMTRLKFTYFLQTEQWDGSDVASVMISTDGVNFDTVANNQLSINNLSDNINRWDTLDIDISSVAGNSTVYISFEFNSIDTQFNNFEGFYVDDIVVYVPVPFDASVVKGYGSEYSKMPIRQILPVGFKGRVSNNGSSGLTNINLDVNVLNNFTNLFSDSVSLSSLAVSEDSLLSMSSQFTPTTYGNYDILFHVSVSENDPITSNDSLILINNFSVTDTTFARDNGNPEAGIGYDFGTGSIGQVYTLSNADTMTSISVYIDGNNNLDTFSFSVFPWVGDTTGSLIYTSPERIFDGSEKDVWNNYGINPLPLSPGDYLVVINQLTQSENIQLGYDTDIEGIVIGYEVSGWIFYYGFGNPMIRVHFVDPNIDTVIFVPQIQDQLKSAIYPNPSTGRFDIVLLMGSEQDVTVTVFDLLGIKVDERRVNKVVNNVVEFDLSHKPSGIYIVNIETPFNKITQRILLAR